MGKTLEDLNRIYDEIKFGSADENEKKLLIGCCLELIHHYHKLDGIEIKCVLKGKIPLPTFSKKGFQTTH